jgi:phage pi2 protein 07
MPDVSVQIPFTAIRVDDIMALQYELNLHPTAVEAAYLISGKYKQFWLQELLDRGHNAKEFDFPFIARRMIINQVTIPNKLNLFGKKPWEIAHLDTLELWKFGDYKHFTSLKLLTKILGIPSPKGDIDGSQVGHVFYVEKDIDRIVTYCEKDVIAVAQVFLRFRNEDLLIEDEIIHV